MTFRSIFASFLAVSISVDLAHAQFVGAPNSCKNEFLATNDRILRSNSFEVARGAAAYVNELGHKFLLEITTLPNEAHWLDAGAGHANAMKGFIKGHTVSIFQKNFQVKLKKMTAVAVEKPKDFIEDVLSPTVTPGLDFKYLTGRYIEDIPFSEIGTCDIITDVFGPLSYTAQIDVVIRKYLELLKVGGVAYVATRSDSIKIEGSDYLKYLRGINGVNVESLGTNSFKITKIGWTRNEDVPSLHLNSFNPSTPPLRRYRLN